MRAAGDSAALRQKLKDISKMNLIEMFLSGQESAFGTDGSVTFRGGMYTD